MESLLKVSALLQLFVKAEQDLQKCSCYIMLPSDKTFPTEKRKRRFPTGISCVSGTMKLCYTSEGTEKRRSKKKKSMFWLECVKVYLSFYIKRCI